MFLIEKLVDCVDFTDIDSKYRNTPRQKEVLTDYTSEAKKIQAYKFETPQNKKQYPQRMPIIEPRFTYNKHNLKYREYHIIGLENTTKMATTQNIIKIHNR